jgi:Glycosyl hydrolases family 28
MMKHPSISISLFLFSAIIFSCNNKNLDVKKGELATKAIQKSIDSCYTLGGGTVFLKKGNYVTGTIILKSNVKLILEKKATLIGSGQYQDYTNDALIFAENAVNFSVEGEGIIDGVDCRNPNGEEGFRGPHCMRFINCKKLRIKGITIKNSANWAINCRKCSEGDIKNVFIRGGHDGLHTRFCSDFKVDSCDFRTGDDTFAGNDNQNFDIKNCKINTSCNGFRMGCMNMNIQNCKIFGPGEYQHKIQKRNNMLAAFVHFSPTDEDPKLKSGNWLVKDVSVENVDNFFNYNFQNGLWQTGQPLTSIVFENVNATGLLKAFEINGGEDKNLRMTIRNASFSNRDSVDTSIDKFEGVNYTSNAFFSASNYKVIEIINMKLLKKGVTKTFEKTELGQKLMLD